MALRAGGWGLGLGWVGIGVGGGDGGDGVWGGGWRCCCCALVRARVCRLPAQKVREKGHEKDVELIGKWVSCAVCGTGN